MGLVYLIHFDESLKHAKHYLGYVEKDVEKRFKRHVDGNGAKILKAANEAGIEYRIARVWYGVDRNFERTMKNRKNTKFYCPVCKEGD